MYIVFNISAIRLFQYFPLTFQKLHSLGVWVVIVELLRLLLLAVLAGLLGVVVVPRLALAHDEHNDQDDEQQGDDDTHDDGDQSCGILRRNLGTKSVNIYCILFSNEIIILLPDEYGSDLPVLWRWQSLTMSPYPRT